MIDWTALMQVAIATVGATILVVAVFAMASSAMSLAHREGRAKGGRRGNALALRTIGYAGFGLAGLFALYGIYLIVPYLHGTQ